MASETVLFSSEEPSDRPRVAAFLRDLADRVLDGQVSLRQGDQVIDLAVPERLVLEIKVEEEAKRGKVKRKLEVEIEWAEGDQLPGGVSFA